MASEDVDVSQLVIYDEEALNLILVANSEYTLNVAKTQQQTVWEPKKEGFERDVVDRYEGL